ncbi:MAG: hypothetical protein DF168_01165 [Candidatus Moanabacter tarae]|uniref:TonB C-terminal domain-containing protein n=1 Tax=Candidatus Moanibacter tarae TaxID=2200854 RepID=A0A2Z4AG20_9BACT|nr:MAG: hypothetical protein DF168_01165 [Candidatus Moanabacter tarae]|tara:strand:- start:21428 stop:22186 length:759 start_codon:yes stop_codon:yes gene_type:complete
MTQESSWSVGFGGRDRVQIRALVFSITLHTVFFFSLLFGSQVNIFRERFESHEFVLTSPPSSVELPLKADPIGEPRLEEVEEFDRVEELESHQEPLSFDEFLERHGPPNTAEFAEIKPPKVAIKSFDLDPLKGRIRDFSHATEGTDVVSKDTTQSELKRYMLSLKKRINQSWNKPKLTNLGGLEATVQFKVDSKGRISEIEVVSTSGNVDFDASVIQAVSLVQGNQALGNVQRLGPTPYGNGYRPRITFRLD